MAESSVSIPAADGSELKGIWCTPEGPGPFPAVLCIHGGGFRAGNRERWNKLCQQLAERGCVAAT